MYDPMDYNDNVPTFEINPQDLLEGHQIPIVGEDGFTDILEIQPLGAGNEVGRSCVVMRFKGKTIMFDCGIHPAFNGMDALPFFDFVNTSEIDILLVSHFHLDHIASLPYFLQKTEFKGRVFMTHPTKAIYKLLLTDYIRISNIGLDEMLFNEQDLNDSMAKIEEMNFHQEKEVSGIRFSCYNAGHVLGACMFLVEIAGVRILYTGDFSRQEDRHLMAAEIPSSKPDVLIVESTYGVQMHSGREEREHQFCDFIHKVVRDGGKCLIPVFALGRAQELLLILEEYWEAHRNELSKVPIYFASSLGKKCMKVYQKYPRMMNANIATLAGISNPFKFEYITDLTSNIDNFIVQDRGPCVVMASPGMLQSGYSRQIFDAWCENSRNGVMIPGYCVEGTLAKTILSDVEEVEKLDGKVVPLKIKVQYISFSAHSDYIGTSTFIEQLTPPNIVLVHGEKNEMLRLQSKLLQDFIGSEMTIYTPANGAIVHLQYNLEKTAKVLGLAASRSMDESSISGVLVQQEYKYSIIAPEELHVHTKLQTTKIIQAQRIPFMGSAYDLLEFQVSQMYEIEKDTVSENPQFVVYDSVTVVLSTDEYIELKWESSPINDMIADSIITLVLQVSQNPFATHNSFKDQNKENFDKIGKLLNLHFGESEVDYDSMRIKLVIDGVEAIYDFPTKEVYCGDEMTKYRIEDVLYLIEGAVLPISKISEIPLIEQNDAMAVDE
eukprot:TRINITY_DN4166_c0_g1_i1.p1 TRINITY_DN4166_c0_g1~~TRINITY_DN4166_c0_g1_i1.p1  ORF type:complete len:720 (-),score=143.48 TRINITY_DN4166_c0_g1_i1:152-2311(-)